MPFAEDPSAMPPEQRRAEIAAILAAAWMRRSRHLAPCTEKRLDSCAPIRPLCDHGLPFDTEEAG